VFVYTISNFCNGYTHNLGSTWELGSGFATSFYLSASPVKNKLKVQSNFIELLLIVIVFDKIPAMPTFLGTYRCTPLEPIHLLQRLLTML
jgi:hypothetical protein